MGSVKDLIRNDSPAGKLFVAPQAGQFGRGAWSVSGRFSVGDLKSEIPDVEIPQQAEALAMMTGRFFEHLQEVAPEAQTCYMGLLDSYNRVVSTDELLSQGETSNIVVMRLAHIPESYCNGNLATYRAALASGELRCGVADVESIFRAGFPLGSSTFEKIFGATGRKDVYNQIATYTETVQHLDDIRSEVASRGVDAFPKLSGVLQAAGLKHIPDPGFLLDDIVYNSTTKFEGTGDRDITKEEEQRFSGLSPAGYSQWTEQVFPSIVSAQIGLCSAARVDNYDGKVECVAFNGLPVLTDFACTVHENRLMLQFIHEGETWTIPSNKEIQRAIFRQEGVYAIREEAKQRAEKAGRIDAWREYVKPIAAERNVDLQGIAEHSVNLMQYAVAEVSNRLLGKTVFDAKPLSQWAPDFIPYASKPTRK